MFVHYLRITFRNILKQKWISSVNIFGLAVGMACAILIFLWVQQQLSYDQWQLKKNNIYRFESESWVILPPYLSETTRAFPEVEQAIRFYFGYEPIINHEDNIFTLTDFALVDSAIFQVFNFNFIYGDPAKALLEPFSVVLTESIAKKLFGDQHPIGKTIKLDTEYDYQVTGVIEDIKKFHMEINAFGSLMDAGKIFGNEEFLKSRNYNYPTFLLLHPKANVSELADHIDQRAREVDQYDGSKLLLRPFTDIYFTNNLQHDAHRNHGNMNMVIAFSVIAVLIVLIACINFINFTLAKTSSREKEIAVRKVVGASPRSIASQFFGETIIIVFIAFLVSLVLIQIVLPDFAHLTGETISLKSMELRFGLILAGLLLFTVFISGIYPSFYLSVIKPVKILKGKSGISQKNSILSKMLISIQFAISIFLIIATIIVVKQLSFMQNSDLGIDHKHVLTCILKGDRFDGNREKWLASKSLFKNKLLASPSVLGVTYINQPLGKLSNTSDWYHTDENITVPIKGLFTNPDFIDVMDLKILEGRNFSFETQTDMNRRIILNEEAVKQFNLTNPVGLTMNSGRNQIIGVVKDFHYNSLHSKIEPVALSWKVWPRIACIKINSADMSNTISHIEAVFRELCPGFGFEYDFIDHTFAQQYAAEQRLEKILKYFVGMAICLSCLGLFALTALIGEQRTKEIGIRKVLGSTNIGIIVLLSKSFSKWILIANIISWPITYVVLKTWLNKFAYHINIDFTIFIISGLLAFCIAILTIGIQAYRTAISNPIDALRHE